MKENNNAPASREPSISNNPSEQKKTPKISRRVLLAGSVGVGVAAASGLYVAGSNWRASLNERIAQEDAAWERNQALAAAEPATTIAEESYKNTAAGLSGPLVYTAYRKDGVYVPATRESPAQNVPYPVIREKMNTYDISGMYLFFAYYNAAKNYGYLTGDLEPLAKIVDPEKVIFPNVYEFIANNQGWIVSDQEIESYMVQTPGYGSREIQGRKIYKLQTELSIYGDAYFVYRDTGEVKYFRDMFHADRHPTIDFYGEFLDGCWVSVDENLQGDLLLPKGASVAGYTK
ncbi:MULTISPECIES: DUF6318 family protein [Rothia]|uniref:DUF6318 family protein n=1 Tax=Rothia TaxID=32207 RepID=UPI0008A4ED59|nr:MULTISPECIES: DUF6318 family protein [Rothia]OFO22488.1 hypothetical protein HMPREF3055_05285 [Rothia sp. HMSC061C12]